MVGQHRDGNAKLIMEKKRRIHHWQEIAHVLSPGNLQILDGRGVRHWYERSANLLEPSYIFGKSLQKCERQICHSNPNACSWVWAAKSAGAGLGMAYNLKFNSWSHDFVFIYFALIGTAYNQCFCSITSRESGQPTGSQKLGQPPRQSTRGPWAA